MLHCTEGWGQRGEFPFSNPLTQQMTKWKKGIHPSDPEFIKMI